MTDLIAFERGQIVDSRLVVAWFTTKVNIVEVSGTRVPQVMTAYLIHGKGTSEKNNCRRKLKHSEKDCQILKRIVSSRNKMDASKDH
ncbi:hypothetical protein AVEN_64585-1 [Araneus ventricosus]|uniref:Uncharacterized protein n=1 Tax=Araneus ventricosus TaxID=182803 RepID=A0A4Y2QMW5_ARAVE|nr:hypothetical protein AVEN_64585-1 [Araneus ventricosus]